MKPVLTRFILVAFVILVVSVVSMITASGQARPDLRPSEQVFKSIQSLKGIPTNEFMATMGFFTASLGESCTYCHIQESGGSWERYADDNGHKRTARRMIAMVNTINKNYFMGRRVLTCYSCHRGNAKPQTTPELEVVYGVPRFPPPDQLLNADTSATQADQILEKYIQAIGGAQRAGSLNSLSAKGTYQGYAAPKYQMEMHAKAPAQLTMIVHDSAGGDTVTTYDGREGWIVAPITDRPLPVSEMTGGELEGARLDAMLSFPAQIKQALRQWRALPPATIDDRDVQLVQGTLDGRYPVNLYFDDESGLLVRMVRYADSPVGLSPTQIDYSDYRDVAGMKIPFKRTVSWLNGRAAILLTEVQPNSVIDPARFARPAANIPGR
jgi:photosynthetic reaction center cytochrome c subunit